MKFIFVHQMSIFNAMTNSFPSKSNIKESYLRYTRHLKTLHILTNFNKKEDTLK